MTDDAKPPPLSTLEEVKEAWDRFRAGGSVLCPRDGVTHALTVDAAVGLYRLVCTECGTATPWFEATPEGMALRSGPTTDPPPMGNEDDELGREE